MIIIEVFGNGEMLEFLKFERTNINSAQELYAEQENQDLFSFFITGKVDKPISDTYIRLHVSKS